MSRVVGGRPACVSMRRSRLGGTSAARFVAVRVHQKSRCACRRVDQGHGLMECASRLGWTLSTVKRYASAASAENLKRPPLYHETLVDAFRDYLRRRRAEEPGVAVTRLLADIRELGYTRSANLLVRYLSQGRANAIRTPPSPRRLVAWLMTRPADLPPLTSSIWTLSTPPVLISTSSANCSPAGEAAHSTPVKIGRHTGRQMRSK